MFFARISKIDFRAKHLQFTGRSLAQPSNPDRYFARRPPQVCRLKAQSWSTPASRVLIVKSRVGLARWPIVKSRSNLLRQLISQPGCSQTDLRLSDWFTSNFVTST